ncbi:cytochrome-c peroxidase [Photobacterium sp. TY1-4]|uniref:cytochrome-c peroxidase n=1 Tax=Photobacterium sp. TY1-4 TaxID=2899122 RepID=UPI0021C0B685|nr:cytochrome c peroxidase [Photobacterium sp. TY1-4]UXI02482.1 cytochrome-c peroxidase [Photobacterium sp. TY1-4]
MKNNNVRKHARLGVFIAVTGLLAASIQQAVAASPEKPSQYLPNNLPEVPGIEKYIKDKDAAIKLGKAFFWDMQAGSQGQSCASCHFAAGADNRAKNQISPSVLHTDPSMKEQFGYKDFQLLPSGGKPGPNYTLTQDDFPLYRLVDDTDRDSAVDYETDDVISSQGVSLAQFVGLNGTNYRSQFEDGKETCENIQDIFHVNGLNTRRVEPRNTPTVINAVYNFRNFWDGRANNVFNGVDPFGDHNKDAYVMAYDMRHGKMTPEKTRLINSSLASQAVGPPGSDFEMTCRGKAFKTMGRKLLRLPPLGLQKVHPSDSSLGSLSAYPAPGLRTDYRTLIRLAFHDKYWMAPHRDKDGYTQIEQNFPLIWGLAIQMYESTLVSLGNTRGDDETKMTELEQRGKQVFNTNGGCSGCHAGNALSSATLSLNGDEKNVLGNFLFVGPFRPGQQPPFELATADTGFFNIGVRPTEDDMGLGGTSPFGAPLSFTRQAMAGDGPDMALIEDQNIPRDAVDGAFKVPLLHNIELTGPYMHNGSLSTLEQVVDFYSRGGNRRLTNPNNPFGGDSSGHNGQNTNLAFNLGPVNLNDEDKHALVAYLKSLTDERVRWEQAPFDHPQLFIPVGHVGDEHSVVDDGTGKALVQWEEIPSVGRHGRKAENLPPVKGFLVENPEEPKAHDDYVEVKYPGEAMINVMDNDEKGYANLDYSSVKIISQPDRFDGVLTNYGDGRISYRPMSKKSVSFTYQIKDKDGLYSNVAKVEIHVKR